MNPSPSGPMHALLNDLQGQPPANLFGSCTLQAIVDAADDDDLPDVVEAAGAPAESPAIGSLEAVLATHLPEPEAEALDATADQTPVAATALPPQSSDVVEETGRASVAQDDRATIHQTIVDMRAQLESIEDRREALLRELDALQARLGAIERQAPAAQSLHGAAPSEESAIAPAAPSDPAAAPAIATAAEPGGKAPASQSERSSSAAAGTVGPKTASGTKRKSGASKKGLRKKASPFQQLLVSLFGPAGRPFAGQPAATVKSKQGAGPSPIERPTQPTPVVPAPATSQALRAVPGEVPAVPLMPNPSILSGSVELEVAPPLPAGGLDALRQSIESLPGVTVLHVWHGVQTGTTIVLALREPLDLAASLAAAECVDEAKYLGVRGKSALVQVRLSESEPPQDE